MTLPVPKLDDRQFQDIVDEAKKRIPYSNKEWTDHNVSDPGVTLIELFAWMVDILLYRLNQVPDLHYIKFLEMLGVKLKPPIPAKVPVTFWLSAPQDTEVVIPSGTEVASTQTETERSIVFTTDVDLHIYPPKRNTVIAVAGTGGDSKKGRREINLRRLEAGFGDVEVFSTVPHVGDALCIGFENDLSHHLLGLTFDFTPTVGAGIDPTHPPYVWEASTGDLDRPWATCDVEMDTTAGMNSAGSVRIHIPRMGRLKIGDHNLFWVRARIREITRSEADQGIGNYIKSPLLKGLTEESWGGTVPATHSQQIQGEHLGRSDGSAGQRFQLQFAPILQRQAGETLIVQVEGEPDQTWREVPDFSETGINDACFTLDDMTGELRFGPAIRQPDGTMKLYGAISPRNANLIFRRYRYGGGELGNVIAGFLNTLKTSIPYVAKVGNRRPATGGADAETLEEAKLRAPAILRSRDRAVTEADYEFLARQAFPQAIGRVRCLQPHTKEGERVIPGQLYILVVPRVPHPEGYLDPKQLELDKEIINVLKDYLDERRMLTTRLEVRRPVYQWVAVKVKLRPAPGIDVEMLQTEVLNRLYRFINPLTGGSDEKGWPFNRALFKSDVYQCLQGITGIQFIRDLEMYKASPSGEADGTPIESVDSLIHGTVASGKHVVELV